MPLKGIAPMSDIDKLREIAAQTSTNKIILFNIWDGQYNSPSYDAYELAHQLEQQLKVLIKNMEEHK